MSIKLDMARFKKIATGDKHTTLRHDDGHEIKIAHKALSPAYRKQLQKLPMEESKAASIDEKSEHKSTSKHEKAHYAEGTPYSPIDIQDAQQQAEAPSIPVPAIPGEHGIPLDVKAPDSANPPQVDRSATAASLKSFESPMGGEQPPILNPTPVGDTPVDTTEMGAMNGPVAPSAPIPSTQAGFEKEQAAITEQGKLQADAAQQQASILHAQIAQAAKMAEDYKSHYDALDKERKALQQDITDRHIDPNHYLGSMDTGQKIATAISLALGGLGQGLAGGPNQAMEFLKSQIDKDIDMQKAEIGKKENLLSANLREFGNLKDASEMTRIMMNDTINTRLGEAAAKSQGPLAISRAKQLSAEIEAKEIAPRMEALAAKKMIAQGEADAQKNPSMYPQLIARLEQTDPKKAQELRERLVPGVGLANTPKDATEVKDITVSATGARKSLADLRSILNSPNKSLDLDSRAKAQSIRQQLIGQLRVAILGPGTVNENERKLLEDLVPDVTSFFSRDKSLATKLGTLDTKLSEGLQQQLSARGVGNAPVSDPRTPTVQEVARKTPDGRTAIFDAASKKFIRYQ